MVIAQPIENATRLILMKWKLITDNKIHQNKNYYVIFTETPTAKARWSFSM